MAEETAPTATPDSAGTITVEMAARLLKVTPQWVRQLVKAGYIKQVSRGRYNLVNVVHGYIDFLKDEERRTSKSAADSRVRDARANEIEMRNAERARLVIPIEEAIEAQDFLVGTVLQVLAGIPARVTRDLETRRKVEAVCNAGQKEIAKAQAAAGDAARSGKPLPYSSAGNDAG